MKKLLFIAAFLASWLPFASVSGQNVAKIGSTEFATLQEAVDAAHDMSGNITVELTTNTSGYAIVHQKAGLNLTIDGKDKTLNGQIIIDGDGKLDGTDALTIQNIKFETPSDLCTGTDAFVVVPSTKTTGTPYYAPSHNNHAHNITISNCTFTGNYPTSNIVGFKSHSGIDGMKNLVMEDVTATNLHSLAQLTATKGATFDNCTATLTGSFIAANGGDGTYTVSNCTFESHPDKADGYAYREKSNSTAEVTLTNNSFKAHDAIILGSAGKISIESGTYDGNVSKTAGTIAISGGTFTADPAPYLAEGCNVQNNGGIYTVIGANTVALIGTTSYETLAEAVAAVKDGETVTLLKDVSLTDRLFVNAGATPAYAGSNNRYATTTENKSITLDLNGYNVTTSSNIALAGGSFNIVNNGTADADHGVISTSGSGLAPIEIRGTGDLTAKRTLTIGENVTIKGGEYGLNIFGSNDEQKNVIEVNVNGKVEGELFVLGNLKNAENDIVINVNGTVDASNAGGDDPKTAISLNGNAKVIVGENAKVTGDTGIEVRAGELTVNGGTIKATASEYSYTPNGSGTTVRGAAIAVAQHNTVLPVTATVNGGTLEGKKAIAVVDVNNNQLDKVTVKAKDELVAENTVIPAGFKWASSEGMSTLAPCDYVAQIEGGAQYETLEEAFAAAANGSTVTLLKDGALTERLFVNAGAEPAYAGTNNRYATTSENKSITLELNGYNVTTGSNIALAGGSLNIINNGTADATHGVISTLGAGLAPIEIRGTGDLTSKRTLTIGENVTLKGADYGLNVFGSNDAQKNVIEVNVNGTVDGVLFVLGNLSNAENDIVINANGKITSTTDAGIALNGNAKVNVAEGAEITGLSGIEVRAGELTVNGGTITATAEEYSYTANGSGTTVKGAAIAVSQHGTLLPTTANVNGGTLAGAKTVAVIAHELNAGLENVTVIAKDELVAENTEIPEGFKWVSSEGMSTLTPCTYVAQIGEAKYESLAAAVAAVPTDGTETTITMIADETIIGNAGVTIPAGKNVVLDLNGKTVTLNVTESKGSQLLTNRGTLTITDSSEEQIGKLTNAADESLAVGSWPTNNYVTNVITNSGTLNIEAGNIISTANGSICYAVDNNSTSYDAILNIKGGYLTSVGTVIRQFCNSTTKQNVINMTGGVVTTNGSAAIWTQLPGSNAASKKLATLNISGGEVTGSSYAWYDYSYGDSFEAVEYNISGGKFTGRLFSYALRDGIISGFISGGLFSPAPSSSYIETPGYMFGPSEEVEGYYTLAPAEVDYSWIENGVEYHDYLPFNTPFKSNYLMDGETITLLQNITLTEDLIWNTEGDATFTLNLGEFKITKGNFSIKLNPGQRVNTDKTTSISTFTAAEEGYVVKSAKDENGKYYYTVEEAEVLYTAANGTVKYMLYSSSMVSSDGTYKLLKDVTTGARLAPGIMASNITLDLNGHTLTSTATDCAILLSRAGSSSKPKTFNLIDTSDEKGGMLKVNPDVNIGIQVSGKYNQITIGEGVTVDGDCIALLGENQTLIVNGTINGGNDFAVSANGSTTKNTTITINEGAVLTSNVAAMYLPGNEGLTATVNGGTITGGTTGIEIRAGQLVVNGGNITSTATEYSYTPNGSGTTTKGAAIAVVQHNTQLPIDAQVLGGTLIGLNQIAVTDAQENDLEGVAVKAKDELVATTTIPEDFKWVDNGDGTSSLAPKAYVAQIGDTKYETLAGAVEAAEDGATITLLAYTDEKVEVGKTLTIVKNSFTAANVTAAESYMKTETDENITIAKLSDLDIVLVDGQPYTFTKTTQVKSASYVRTVKANTYCAWYVPFDYTIKAEDLEKLTFYRINLIANAPEQGDVESTEQVWIFLTKMSAGDKLTANRPYVIKSTTAQEFTFTTDAATLYAPVSDSRLINSTSAYDYNFFGIYKQIGLAPEGDVYNYYVNGNGQVSKAANKVIQVGSYRWYIKATPKGAYAPPFFGFTDGDSNTTGIQIEDGVKTIDSYYNLNGMKIEKPGKGAYIIKFSDGSTKKVVK